MVAALGHYQIWFALRGEGKAWDTHRDVMNDSRVVDFFKGTIIAHYKMMFIEMACLFDSGEESHSIRNLKEKMREAGLGGLADRFDEELKPFSNLASNIKTIRSKVTAHKDIGADDKSLYQKHGIKPNDIGRLLNTAAFLMSDLESVINDGANFSTVSPTDRWEKATLGILELLRSARSS